MSFRKKKTNRDKSTPAMIIPKRNNIEKDAQIEASIIPNSIVPRSKALKGPRPPKRRFVTN
jgi:hypothetical protein